MDTPTIEAILYDPSLAGPHDTVRMEPKMAWFYDFVPNLTLNAPFVEININTIVFKIKSKKDTGRRYKFWCSHPMTSIFNRLSYYHADDEHDAYEYNKITSCTNILFEITNDQ